MDDKQSCSKTLTNRQDQIWMKGNKSFKNQLTALLFDHTTKSLLRENSTLFLLFMTFEEI